MSYCTHCLQRLCRKHPLQDHGERANKILQLAKSSTSKLSVAALIQTQIDKLEAEAKGTSTIENDNYRNELEHERMKINSLKRKSTSSSSYNNTSSSVINNNKLAKYSNSGLNPSVLSVMIENSDSDIETTNSNNNHESNSIRSQNNKHDKKKDKKSKHKKSKKKKKHKND